MRILNIYSHWNGVEHLEYHKPERWSEIEDVIAAIDASSCLKTESKEKDNRIPCHYSSAALTKRYSAELHLRGWLSAEEANWVTSDPALIRTTLTVPRAERRQKIEEAGLTPISSYRRIDFVKDEIVVDVNFGNNGFNSYDLFARHAALFNVGVMNVGVEIVPMKELQEEMSSDVPHYEGALYDLIRQGRSAPAVPLVLVGIAA